MPTVSSRRIIPEGAALPLGLLIGSSALTTAVVWLTPEPDIFTAIIRMAVAAMSLAVAVYLWRNMYRAEVDLFSLKGWPLALVSFFAVELVRLIFGEPSLRGFSAGGAAFWLVWYLLFTGVVEELWWRGIWFAIWRGRPFVCIIVGSLLFGLMHIGQNDIYSALVIVSIGTVLGAARYRGASIGSLVLAHGVINWLNITILDWSERALPLLGDGRNAALRFAAYASFAWLIFRLSPMRTVATQVAEQKN